MPSIPIDDLVYRDPTVRAGVTLAKAEDVADKRVMSLADFDFRVPSDRPGEAAPIRLTEGYYADRYPGLPDNAAFALTRAGEAMMAKQIRSEWKKAQKKLSISKGVKLISFD